MKKSFLALCALTLAAGLSACGGGTSKYTIGGTVIGLHYGPEYGPLVLTMNGTEISVNPVPPESGSTTPKDVTFAFPKQLDYGEAYDIALKKTTAANGDQVEQQPPHQICKFAPKTYPKDVAGRLSTQNTQIYCALTENTVGGTVTGLTDGDLVLTNGSDTITVAKAATADAQQTFTFATKVTYKQTYGVTVLSQPATQTCSVGNGVGLMGDVAVTTVVVTCQARK